MTTENTGRTASGKARRFNQLIDDMYDFYFIDRKRQWVTYTLTLVIAALYSTVGTIVLRRPERVVIWEAILVASILLVCFPLAYVLTDGRSREDVLEILLPKAIHAIYRDIAAKEHVEVEQVIARVAIEYADVEREHSRQRVLMLESLEEDRRAKKRVS